VAEAALVDGWGEPASWLHDAAAFFEGTGHDRIVAACRSLLRKAGVTMRRRGRGESDVPPAMQKLTITSREMDVLVLVGERLKIGIDCCTCRRAPWRSTSSSSCQRRVRAAARSWRPCSTASRKRIRQLNYVDIGN
jgi:hypothetical protein